MDKQKYMLYSERKNLADEYEEWVKKPLEDGSKIKDCPLSVITFMLIKGFCKIPENAVVLNVSEYVRLKSIEENIDRVIKQKCKEMAEKFAERVKEETDHGISALYDSTVDEICKEFTK